jgi:WD40 repeat protein
MPEVFISYSRKDKNFVAQLQEALAKHQREAWLDTKDIPPTAEWLKEIYTAIEGADSFVFIISPEVLNSEVCQLELSHAVKHHKRLIPVVRRDVNPREVPDILARLHWIFCREKDDFNDAFQALLSAMATDLDHVRAHTQLLLKALEWEGRGRDKSLLLRGAELKRSEEWLVAGRDREPESTPLQVQFLLASRQAETGRQRKTLTAVALGLVVAISLAMVAFYQYRVAYHRGRVALSRQLAAQSQGLLDRELDLALLLAIEARRVADTLEAKGSLQAGLLHTPQLITFLQGQSKSARCVAFSPDGKTLASGGKDGSVTLYDLDTKRPSGPPLKGHDYQVESVAFSPDGKKLASGDADGAIVVWDLVTRKPLEPPLEGQDTGVTCVTFSPDGKILASSGTGAKTGGDDINLWEVATGQRRRAPIDGDRQAMCVAFSPDGRLLASAGDGQRIIFWEASTGKALNRLLKPNKDIITGIAFGPDGKILATAGESDYVLLWDVAQRRTLGKPLKGHTRAVFSPDGKTLATAGDDHSIILWEVASQQSLGPPLKGHTNDVNNLAFSPDGKTLAAADGDGNLILWHMSKTLPLVKFLKKCTNFFQGVAISADGKVLAGISDDETVGFWEAATGRSLGQPIKVHKCHRLALSPDGKILATAGYGNTISLWEVARRRPFGAPLQVEKRVESLAFSPDGAILASGDWADNVMLWDVKTCQPLSFPLGFPQKGHANNVNSVAFSPDNKTLASGSSDMTIIFWDLVTHRPLGPPVAEQNNAIEKVAFSPDGKILASAGMGGAIFLWDVETRQPLGPPLLWQEGGLPFVMLLAFSPDGKILASEWSRGISEQETIILWDLATRRPLGSPLRGHTKSIDLLAFAPDGKSLTATDEDGNLILWDVDPTSWQERACRIANRNLTKEEWQRYLGDEPYHLTCPGLPEPGKP